MNKTALEEQVGDQSIGGVLARYVDAVKFDDLPGNVVTQAKLLILDAVGIALASTQFPFFASAMGAMQDLDATGNAAVIGCRDSLPMRDAALVNGILIHGLDFDDTHMGSVVHPTASLLPTVLAVAGNRNASGREALTAYVAGIEVATRLGAVARGGFHKVGFHPTSLVGVFACALAAGKLHGLNVAQLAWAQGVALSFSAGTFEFLEDGSWTKRLHPGWAAHAGITSTALAKRDYVGVVRPYEGKFGLYATHLHTFPDDEAVALATADLGRVWETMQVAVKPYPACHFTHACADAARALLAEGLDPASIESVVARVPAGVVGIVCEPVETKLEPKTAYDAQFSIPYVVATALLRGRFGLAELEPAAIRDPAVLALARRVQYEVDETSTFPKYYTGELIVTTKDGRVLRHREDMNRGCGDRPLGAAEIEEKFFQNAALAVSKAHVQRIHQSIMRIDEMSDLTELCAVLALSDQR